MCAAVSAAALACGAVLPAQAATSTGWRSVFSTHYGVADNYSIYSAVVATSGSNAWALGGSDVSNGNGTTQQVEAAHWNGSGWKTVSMPSGVKSYIDAASAPAANDIWAVTTAGGSILHYNGSKWSLAHTLPSSPAELTGVLAFSATNVWVFGGPGAEPGYGTYHYNGRSWSKVSGTIPAGIVTASAVSASNIWAIGSASSPDDSIVHYNGTSWTKRTGSVLSGLTFRGVRAVSSSRVWITAESNTSRTTSYLLHYNGSSISKIKVPYSVSVGRVTQDGHSGVWMLGTDTNNTSYAIHMTSAGVWSRVSLGLAASLETVPGTTAEWAVGDKYGTTGGSAVIWEYGTP